MTRQMFRYEVPVDDQAHDFRLTCDPVAVAAVPVQRRDYSGWIVEFWAEHDDDPGKAQVLRAFRVFGTGQPLPPDARWVGTCEHVVGLVWHLYQVTP